KLAPFVRILLPPSTPTPFMVLTLPPPLSVKWLISSTTTKSARAAEVVVSGVSGRAPLNWLSDRGYVMTGAAEKVNLLGMPKAKLEAFFETLGEKRFRAQQVLQWMHQRGVDD